MKNLPSLAIHSYTIVHVNKLPRKPSYPLSTGRPLMLTRPQAPVTFRRTWCKNMNTGKLVSSNP